VAAGGVNNFVFPLAPWLQVVARVQVEVEVFEGLQVVTRVQVEVEVFEGLTTCQVEAQRRSSVVEGFCKSNLKLPSDPSHERTAFQDCKGGETSFIVKLRKGFSVCKQPSS
jgi:hypothetical protein